MENKETNSIFALPKNKTKVIKNTVRGGAEVARWAHNPKVIGSNPVPATTEKSSPFLVGISFFVSSTWAYANKDINYAASGELTPKRDQTTSYFLHQFLPAMIILELIGILLPFNRICQ